MSSSGLGSANFYADFGTLSALKKDVKASDPQALRAAARQFESLFTEMMLKAMREAKLGAGLGDSQEGDLYQDMYDQQLALQMSQGKGLGLADLLVQQLTRSGATNAAVSSSAGNAAGSGATARAAGAVAPPSTAKAAPAAPAASAAPHASRSQRLNFIQRLAPYAERAGAQLGVSADNLIAQAALETGWGQHIPAAGGSSSNNLFGIKAARSWSGATVAATTTEYQPSGARSSGPQSFRAYGSLQQGINDYVSVLQRRAALQPALGTGADASAFASALQRGGYSTDPYYADKLAATAAEVSALRAHAGRVADAATGANTPDAALKLVATLPTTSGGDSA